ncbi:hypothetical protein K7X08_004973 [Anisodus acutangulus]|uniref:Peptidase S8/S53 domain-containing protein n=1 Tax=Anisodus acutangulus TaxID=402998 RepID=A0A9Q1RIC1_9SOLA|nr:hypothetical protein K7X08_004973 [Anisodus acutangulus]
MSPRDSHGHGTHTASTAGGAAVPMAGVLGNGAGEARGMAPGAHIAIYKVCWFSGCYSSDILAATDVAIRDGVDILSLSLGGFPVPLYDDTIAIGSFRAMEHGISVICAAGNNGPMQKDRYQEHKSRGKWLCDRGVNGRTEKGQVVKEAGGAAMILANTTVNLEEDSVDVHVLPATLIGFDQSIQLENYLNSTKRPTAQFIIGGTVIGKSRAPAVAQFSLRGPSYTDPSILKPDLIAPGVNIIAAWPQNLGPSGLPEDSRRVNFTVMSGTSMACPHVSGIAALLHSARPKWTPAAVKSSLVTTADTTDHLGKLIMDGDAPSKLLAAGAGHVNPGRAIDPGLIYDNPC